MKHDKVLITCENMERLRCLLDSRKSAGDRDRAHLEILAQKLDSARIVTSDRIPHDVVTMNSQVRLNHLDAGQVKISRWYFRRARMSRKEMFRCLLPSERPFWGTAPVL